MSAIGDLLIRNVYEKGNLTKIVFRYPIISDHKKIVNILTRKESKVKHLKNLVLKRVILTIGGYDTGDGFQYTVWGLGNPNSGRRIYLDGTKYPIKLDKDQMVSELSFSFLKEGKKFRMRFVNDFVEIRPRPSRSIVNELISLLKETLSSNPRIFLFSAQEKLRSAKIDFLRGRYRSTIHNIYYAMFNAINSLQAIEEREFYLEHSKVSETLEQIFSRIRQEKTEIVGREYFQKLNLDEYLSVVEEARDLRNLADYRVRFEAGGNEQRLSEMLSKAEELVTLSNYIVDKCVSSRYGKAILHFPHEQDEFPLPDDLYDYITRPHRKEDLVMESLLVLADDFDATVFAYRLLTRSDVYLTKFSWSFFQGGNFVKYENGCYSIQSGPGKGFIELSRKTVKKWSAIIKPHYLEELGVSKENTTQRLCIFFIDCFLEMYIFPDGRIYLFSPVDKAGFHLQLEAFRNMERIIKKIISKNWPDYSVLSSTIEILQKK